MINRYLVLFILLSHQFIHPMFIPVEDYAIYDQNSLQRVRLPKDKGEAIFPHALYPSHTTDHIKTVAECCWAEINQGSSDKLLFGHLYPCNAIIVHTNKKILGFHQSIQSNIASLVATTKNNFTAQEIANSLQIVVHTNDMGTDFKDPKKGHANKSFAQLTKSPSQKASLATLANNLHTQLDIPKKNIYINLFSSPVTEKLSKKYNDTINSIVVGFNPQGAVITYSLGMDVRNLLTNPGSFKGTYATDYDTYTYTIAQTPPTKVFDKLSEPTDTNAIAAYMMLEDAFTLEPTTSFIHLETLLCTNPTCAQCSKKR